MRKRTKSAAQAFVADGAGRMVGFVDRRFDKGAWPIEVPVAAEHSDRWLRAMAAECQHRNWIWSDLKEAGRVENSGSTTIRSSAGLDSPELVVRWSRRRDGPLCVRARLAGTPEFSSGLAAEFFAAIHERCRRC